MWSAEQSWNLWKEKWCHRCTRTRPSAGWWTVNKEAFQEKQERKTKTYLSGTRFTLAVMLLPSAFLASPVDCLRQMVVLVSVRVHLLWLGFQWVESFRFSTSVFFKITLLLARAAKSEVCSRGFVSPGRGQKFLFHSERRRGDKIPIFIEIFLFSDFAPYLLD